MKLFIWFLFSLSSFSNLLYEINIDAIRQILTASANS